MIRKLYKDAVLTRDVPEHGLIRFDVVKLVDEHIGRDGSLGYSIEVFSQGDGSQMLLAKSAAANSDNSIRNCT